MFFRILLAGLILTCCGAVASVASDEQHEVLTACDPYLPKQEVSGEFRIVGSTTMQQLAALWSDGFQRIHPQVRIDIDCRGSGAAVPTLAKDQTAVGQQNDRDRYVDEVYRQLNGAAPTVEQHQLLREQLEKQGDIRHRFARDLLDERNRAEILPGGER